MRLRWLFWLYVKYGFWEQGDGYGKLPITVPLESSGSDLSFLIRATALVEPDLESYTIRLPV